MAQEMSSRRFELASAAIVLVAIIGLSGGTFPNPLWGWNASQSVSGLAGGVTPQVPDQGVHVVTTSVSQIEPLTWQFSSGNQSGQQSVWLESEGSLYEDVRKRRARLLICIEIARRIAAEPLGLTEVAVLVRVNFGQAKSCLIEMVGAGLVELDALRDGRRYTLTKKGLLFLRSGEMTVKLLQPDDGRPHKEFVFEEAERRI